MLTNIQALRAVAAFLVVFVHLKVLVTRLGMSPDVLEFGNSGVDMFFVISGMIMVMTTARRTPTAWTFMRNRIARIVPFYWLVTLAVFGIALAAPQLLSNTRGDLGDLLRSLLFIPYPRLNGMIMPVVFVGWTLNYEMAFYALFAAGLLLNNRRLGLALTLVVLGCVAAFGWIAHPRTPTMAFYSAPIILEFALGMLIGVVAFNIPPGSVPKSLVLATAAAAFVVMVASSAIWPHSERLFACGLPAAVVVSSAVHLERSGWVVKHPVLMRLGDASFATYLTHFFVTQAVVKVVLALNVTQPAALVAIIFATLMLVAAVGLAVHYAIERPLADGCKRLLGQRSPRLPPAPAGTAQDVVV